MAAEYSDTADMLIVFGITGDLAKVMTFRSLYRLERWGLSTARSSESQSTTGRSSACAGTRGCIEGTGEPLDDAVFERFAARLSYVSGDFNDAATYERVGPRGRMRTAGLLSGVPAVSVRAVIG